MQSHENVEIFNKIIIPNYFIKEDARSEAGKTRKPNASGILQIFREAPFPTLQ